LKHPFNAFCFSATPDWESSWVAPSAAFLRDFTMPCRPNIIPATPKLWQSRLLAGGIAGMVSLSVSSLGLTQTTKPTARPATAPSAAPATSSPSLATPFRPILKAGSRGTEVTELQAALQLLGYFEGSVDGIYGQTTVAAVSQFQKAAGLGSDGIVGPATWNQLFPSVPGAPGTSGSPTGQTPTPKPPAGKPATGKPTTNPPTKKPETSGQSSPTPPPPESVALPILRSGMKGPAVINLQERLQAIGVFNGSVDGVFGPDTLSAVKAAQRKFKLDPDGIVGASTWSVLLR